MRILLAEDERSLSRAMMALLERQPIILPMRSMTGKRRWHIWSCGNYERWFWT